MWIAALAANPKSACWINGQDITKVTLSSPCTMKDSPLMVCVNNTRFVVARRVHWFTAKEMSLLPSGGMCQRKETMVGIGPWYSKDGWRRAWEHEISWINVRQRDMISKSSHLDCTVVSSCFKAAHVTTASPPTAAWTIVATTSLLVSFSLSFLYVKRFSSASEKCHLM